MTGTVNWKIYDGKLGSWSWRVGVGAKKGSPKGHPMTTAWEAVILGDHRTTVTLDCPGTGQLSPEIEIRYHQ